MPRALALVVAAAVVAVPVAGQPPAAPPDGPLPRPSRPYRPAAPPPAGPPRFDRHGDPLPAGAVARFGSVRLRHGRGLSGLGFTADGKYLVSISATDDGLRVWEPASGKEVARLSTPLQTAAVAPDRTVLFVADGKVRVWEPLAAGRVRELPPRTLPPEGASALAVHPGGKVFAAAVPGGIALIDLATGETKAELRVPGDQPPLRVTFAPDGRWVAAAGPRTGVWLWNLATLRRVRTYPNPSDHLDFAFSPDGARIAVAGGPLAVYHTDSEELVEGFTPPDNPVHAARFSADGKSLFALQADGTLDRLDATTGEAKDTWPPADGVVPQAPPVVAANGAWVAAIDDTGGIRVWNPKDGSGPAVERLTPLIDPGFSADGTVASALTIDGKKVVTFDPATGAPGKVWETGLGAANGVAWNARAGLAVGVGTAGDGAEVHVVDVARKKVVARIPVPAGEFPKVAFCPTDPARVGLLIAGSGTVYETLTGRPVRAFEVGQPEIPKSGEISPDGRLVAVSTNPVTVWEVATGRKRFELGGHADPTALAFSPDGRRLAVADAEEVLVFDLRTGAVVRRVRAPGPDPMFTALAFAPDGARLATGGADGVVILWDVATGDARVTFDRHEGGVTGIAFSADGTRILSAAIDGTVLIWDATARPAAPPAVPGVDEAFGLLASPDPAAAHRGIAYLDRTPDAAVRLLAERVAVPTAVPADRIARLVTQLGNSDFQTRQAAVKELEGIGAEAGPALREVAAAPPNPEVRRLAGDLLNRLAAPPTRADDLRVIRAVEVLEGVASPAARDVLTKWAAGPAHHRRTTEAAAALRRLAGLAP